MALAEALHHSSGPATKKVVERREGPEGEVRETHYALRGQKRPLPGTRPAPLPVVAVPQDRLEAAARVSSGVPSVAPPALAAPAAEGVDSSTLRFLAAAVLYSRKLKEEEVRKREEEEELKRIRNIPLNQLTPSNNGRSCLGWTRRRRRRRRRLRLARRLLLRVELPRGRGRRGGRGGRLVPPLFLDALVVDTDSGMFLFDMWSMSLLCSSAVTTRFAPTITSTSGSS